MGILRNLAYLQEVANTKSINKAADNLFISKSALSTALKNLEEEFGLPLLNRSIHGVSLTEAGEIVVERASLIFNILDGIREECAMYNENKQILNIYTEPQFANTILPHIITELKMHKTNRYITTNSVEFEKIFDKVREDVDSIGLFISSDWNGQPPEKEPLYDSLVFKHIAAFNLCVVTAKYSKFISLNVKELTYEDIKNVPQIELVISKEYANTDVWMEQNPNPGNNFVMTTDNNTVYFQAILNDIGIGQLVDINISYGLTDRNKLRFIPLTDTQPIDLWLVCNKESDFKIMDELCERIKNAVK